MCDYKISAALDDLIAENIDPEKLTPEEKERSLKLRVQDHKPEDLLAVVRRFLKDSDEIFQKQIAGFEPPLPGGRHPANANDLPPHFPKVSTKKKNHPAGNSAAPQFGSQASVRNQGKTLN